jgi:hypothetical protein
LGGILSKGVPPGSVLDEETYNKMIETMPELEDQFMKTIDGSFKYVGDKELGVDDLNLGEMLEETRELSSLYENSKDAAANIDFKGLSTADYTFDEEMQTYEDAVDAAQDALDTAQANAEGFHPIAYESLEAAVDSATDSLDAAEDKVTSLKTANDTMVTSLATGLSQVMSDENIMAVAEK